VSPHLLLLGCGSNNSKWKERASEFRLGAGGVSVLLLLVWVCTLVLCFDIFARCFWESSAQIKKQDQANFWTAPPRLA
jgi:hypothetical protein